jgi:hypothetical protein
MMGEKEMQSVVFNYWRMRNMRVFLFSIIGEAKEV